MFLDAGQLVLFTIGLIVFFGYFVIQKFALPRVEQFKLLISYLGGISVILVCYSIYFTIRSTNETAVHQLAFDTMKVTQRQWTNPLKELKNYFPDSYYLYASMFPEENFKEVPKGINEKKRRVIELYFSNKIYQVLEDFLTTRKLENSGEESWLNIFFMWMQSPILIKNWYPVVQCYNQDTRYLIEDCIEVGKKLIALREDKKAPLTAEDYDKFSDAFKVRES